MKVELRKVKVTLAKRASPLFAIQSFSAAAGAKILIEGPSGRGKTTLLHLIAGLFHAESGTVDIDDHRLSNLSPSELGRLRREKIGIVFQKLNVIDYLTARENAGLALTAIGPESDERVRSALMDVRLSDRSDVRAGILSLGEQQRVAVARVLAQRPALLLADEPTSSLDDASADLVAEALFKATGSGTLIAVSHDHRLRRYFKQCIRFEELISS